MIFFCLVVPLMSLQSALAAEIDACTHLLFTGMCYIRHIHPGTVTEDNVMSSKYLNTKY